MHHPELHTYPAGITSPELGQYDEAIRAALRWVIEHDSDHRILVSVADKQALAASGLLTQLNSRNKIKIDTRNRRPRRSWNGPVVGAAVNSYDLDRLPFHGATVVCLTSWGVNYDAPKTIDAPMAKLRPWVVGTGAVGVGGQVAWSDGLDSDGTLSEDEADIIESGTSFLNFANSLRSGFEKRDLVNALRRLHQHSDGINLDALQAWAWSQGWGGHHIADLMEFAGKINAGKKIQIR